MPLQESVQVVAQLHLGLEYVRLHALADAVACFGHLHHLVPELFISLGEVIAAVGQGQIPIFLDDPGPDLVDLVAIRKIFGFGLFCGYFGTEAPLAGKGDLLRQGELLIGHGLLSKTPGVHRQVEDVDG